MTIVTPAVELAIDQSIGIDLFNTAADCLERPKDDLELVTMLMRAAWARGYYLALSDRGGFLADHGFVKP